MHGQGNDGIAVISMPDDTTCRCGEQLRAGERAGFDLVRNEAICLRCIADRRAGRPQVFNRPQQTHPQQNRHLSAVPSAASGSGPVVGSGLDLGAGRASAGPVGVWLAPGPARRPSREPRTWVTVLIAALVVGLVGVPVGLRASGMFAGPSVAPDDPTAFAFMNTNPHGQPVTWDPCLTIELVVNLASAPAGADALLREAVDRVNAASGLHLTVIGTTTQAPQPEGERNLSNGRPGSGRAPVLVAWTTPATIPGLKGRVVGLGGPVWQYANSQDQERYIGGTVSLDGPQLAQILARPDGHAQARAVIMHELGHVVGLNHVTNTSQIMAGEGGRATEFGKGDLAGLSRLGSGGCPYDLTPDTPTEPPS